MPNDWLNVLSILTVLLGLMLVLRLIQRRYAPHPELIRKLLHVSMGLITLSFPWLFHSALPVVILAVLAVGWMGLLKFYAPLRDRLGSVLGGVGRQSLGEIYFPISIALIFVLAQSDPLLYIIPMLLLTLADAVAAIIGVRYGRLHYKTTDGQKSAEGSITFFMVAFFSAHVPLLLFSQTGRAETLLIAIILGLLVMLLEAIAWRGLDNLFIPLGGFLLLKTHLEMAVPDLLVRLFVTLALVAFVLCWRKKTTLNDSALLGVAFIGYLSWAVGGWQWFIPPGILFITYPLFVPWIDQHQSPLSDTERQMMLWLPTDPDTHPRQWERVHNIYSVLSVCAAGLLWLTLFVLLDRPEFLYPYTLAYSANLAVIGVAGISPVNYWHLSQIGFLLANILKAWVILALPMLCVIGISPVLLLHAGLILLGTMLAAIGYYLAQPLLRSLPTDLPAWSCRPIFALLGSLLCLLPLLQ
ncbi:MAG TPA: hypothetical protein V6D10_20005 [Trichocoleus sp.]|jgi:phytol kinase